MKIRVAEHAKLSPEKMAKIALATTSRAQLDLYCVGPGQAQSVHTHPDQDKIYYVVEGRGRFTLGEIRQTVTYHDACHLVHGQKVREAPRDLLRRIPGLRLVELPDSDLCCGSAGVYNLMEPEIARELGRRKVERIRETGVRVVVSGNPGCLMQIACEARAQGIALEVRHPVELLARALRTE